MQVCVALTHSPVCEQVGTKVVGVCHMSQGFHPSNTFVPTERYREGEEEEDGERGEEKKRRERGGEE